MHMPMHMSTDIFESMSIHMPTHMSVHISTHMSVHMANREARLAYIVMAHVVMAYIVMACTGATMNWGNAARTKVLPPELERFRGGTKMSLTGTTSAGSVTTKASPARTKIAFFA